MTFVKRVLRIVPVHGLVSGLLMLLSTGSAHAEPALQKGDHICYIGNTLADRMQHDGWLESFIQTRFPELELVFRDLGFPGDELTRRVF